MVSYNIIILFRYEKNLFPTIHWAIGALIVKSYINFTTCYNCLTTIIACPSLNTCM